MAIYRPPKPRWPLALGTALAGLVAGLLLGLAIGSDDPDPALAARRVKTALAAAAGSVEVAAVEYAESVSGGTVTRRPEYEGSLAALASARDRFVEVRPALQVLAPATAEGIDDRFRRSEELMRSIADPDEVVEELEDLRAALTGG